MDSKWFTLGVAIEDIDLGDVVEYGTIDGKSYLRRRGSRTATDARKPDPFDADDCLRVERGRPVDDVTVDYVRGQLLPNWRPLGVTNDPPDLGPDEVELPVKRSWGGWEVHVSIPAHFSADIIEFFFGRATAAFYYDRDHAVHPFVD